MSLLTDFFAAVQFLTRIPVPTLPYSEATLPRAAKFFPVVGLLVGAITALAHSLLATHLSRLATASLTITLLVLLTGAFHEDGLADTADGFGGGWSREQVLLILRDSRIGSFGGVALGLSLLVRVTLLSSVPLAQVSRTLIAAHILCRWTTLPLSYYLPAARPPADGQGSRVAQLVSRPSLILGTVFTLAGTVLLLHWRAIPAILLACAVTLLSGLYYRHRIGGVTGDCFGATNQLTEISIYLVGAFAL